MEKPCLLQLSPAFLVPDFLFSWYTDAGFAYLSVFYSRFWVFPRKSVDTWPGFSLPHPTKFPAARAVAVSLNSRHFFPH